MMRLMNDSLAAWLLRCFYLRRLCFQSPASGWGEEGQRGQAERDGPHYDSPQVGPSQLGDSLRFFRFSRFLGNERSFLLFQATLVTTSPHSPRNYLRRRSGTNAGWSHIALLHSRQSIRIHNSGLQVSRNTFEHPAAAAAAVYPPLNY